MRQKGRNMRSHRHIITALALVAAVFGRTDAMAENRTEQATFGGGCFWCIEAMFEELKGVESVVSGYAGGKGPATYKEVCSGTTGHAEVVQVTFDPDVISYRELVSIFFAAHDPTTLNRQGADVGTQYRSVIFVHDQAQKDAVDEVVALLREQKVFKDPIVTEVTGLKKFHVAEDYHQDYYENNKSQGYCQVVINPKLAKFRQEFADRLK